MESDDPSIPEFASWDSYSQFAKRVRRERRFATDQASRAFLATVMMTASQREFPLKKGSQLIRAQIGAEERGEASEDGAIEVIRFWGYGAERMKPIAAKAKEGRANPAGVAYLYFASDITTAISEVRPWIGSWVSVARFQTARDLRLVDLTKGHGKFGILELPAGQHPQSVGAEAKRLAVWTDIDAAFSWPVTRDENNMDYVPTQILAEAFHECGYDGLVYGSNFGDPGYNVVLFDLESATAISCAAFQIKQVIVSHEELGETWYAGGDEIRNSGTTDSSK